MCICWFLPQIQPAGTVWVGTYVRAVDTRLASRTCAAPPPRESAAATWMLRSGQHPGAPRPISTLSGFLARVEGESAPGYGEKVL